MIQITVLLENTSVREDILCRHGLSIHVRTPEHSILLDMGPDEAFARNAEVLGIDLEKVDLAVLSHGHYDHGGGLTTFFRRNDHAPLYLREEALGGQYSRSGSPEPRYIGLEAPMDRSRLHFAGDVLTIDRELTLFSAVRCQEPPLRSNAVLLRQEGEHLVQDTFRHEQNLLITVEDTAVLLAGCAHRGIVPILEQCEALLGRSPDVVLGGFHLHSPRTGETEPEPVIRQIGAELARRGSRYYTGHCTGSRAYDQLKQQLGDRLLPMYGGLVLKI